MKRKLFVLSLLTARRDYDVAKILYKSGLLSKFFIDAYYSPNKFPFPILDRVLPKKWVKTYTRYQPAIPKEYLQTDWITGLRFRYEFSKFLTKEKYQAQVKAYISLTNQTIKYCEKDSSVNSYYGLDTASVEFFEWATKRDFYLSLEQCVAPRQTQIKSHLFFKDEIGLSTDDDIENCKKLQDRELKEWELANDIIVPSQFVYDELISQGVSSAKLRLVPFGYQPYLPFSTRKNLLDIKFASLIKNKPIVLFAGNAGFRKGVHDVLSVSKLVDADFFIAGHIEPSIYEMYFKGNFPNVRFIGKLPFGELQDYYAKADVFFFPSYLEGSAMVIFEAMSWGLPILTSYQTGSVISHGKEGFLINAGDIDNMVSYLGQMISDSDLRIRLGMAALTTAEYYSFEKYSENLLMEIG